MTLDIVFTLLNVVWGLILIGIGIEMVNNPPDVRWKKWLYRSLFGLFGTAVIVTTLLQSTRNAHEQEQARVQAEARERALSDKVSRSDGKLDAIAHFEEQFLTFVSQQRPTSNTPDAATKAYEAMALSVMKMAQGPGSTGAADARLEILNDNSELNGQTILIPASPPNTAQFIQLPDFRFKNIGGRATGVVSARLYFSRQCVSFGPWQQTASDEREFPSAAYSAAGGVIINPQETWDWNPFSGQAPQSLSEPLKVKLKVFYGANKPAEATFTVRKKPE